MPHSTTQHTTTLLNRSSLRALVSRCYLWPIPSSLGIYGTLGPHLSCCQLCLSLLIQGIQPQQKHSQALTNKTVLLQHFSVLLMEKGFGEFRLLAAVLTMQRSKNEVNTLLVTRYELRKKIRMLVEDLGPTYASPPPLSLKQHNSPWYSLSLALSLSLYL